MRPFKHAFLSLVRKPTKAILFFTILTVVFSLIFTGIILQKSISKSNDYVRQSMGAVVQMSQNIRKALDDQLPPTEMESKIALSPGLAETMAKDLTVKDLYIFELALGTSEEYVSALEEGLPFILLGCRQNIPIQFVVGNLTLAEGRYIEDEDASKNVILVSEEFASKNKLGVGDTLTISSSSNERYDFEIIGIFTGSLSGNVDHMYTTNGSIRMMNRAMGDYSQIGSIFFQLNDPLDVDSFIAKYQPNLPTEYIYLDAGNQEYKKLTHPLKLMSTITKLLLIAVFVAGALIMFAIVSLYIRDRQFEIGLLLSNGETKLNILTQFVVEIFIVVILAFSISAFISQGTSHFVANWITDSQLVEPDESTATWTLKDYGMGQDLSGDVNMSDVAATFSVSINAETYFQLILISIGMLFISTAAPLFIILGYKPRESLQQ